MMANQTTIAGSPRKPLSRWFAKRSRMVGVLLFGWLAFWITTIVNPCCNAFAIGPADTAPIATTTPGATGVPAHSHVSPGQDQVHNHGQVQVQDQEQDSDYCPQLVLINVIFPDQFIVPPQGSDHGLPMVITSYTVPNVAAMEMLSSTHLHDPPPPRRLYLSTLRLLI